jgi:hypothetical protein
MQTLTRDERASITQKSTTTTLAWWGTGKDKRGEH